MRFIIIFSPPEVTVTAKEKCPTLPEAKRWVEYTGKKPVLGVPARQVLPSDGQIDKQPRRDATLTPEI